MRIQHPNDELGAMLLLTVPNIVVHRLDAWSPLVPTSLLEHCAEICDGAATDSYRFPAVVQRQADTDAKSRESDAPEVRACVWGGVARRDISNGGGLVLEAHLPHHDLTATPTPPPPSRQPPPPSLSSQAARTLDELLGKEGGQWHGRAMIDFLRETETEVVVVLEGINPITSATIQARYSYT